MYRLIDAFWPVDVISIDSYLPTYTEWSNETSNLTQKMASLRITTKYNFPNLASFCKILACSYQYFGTLTKLVGSFGTKTVSTETKHITAYCTYFIDPTLCVQRSSILTRLSKPMLLGERSAKFQTENPASKLVTTSGYPIHFIKVKYILVRPAFGILQTNNNHNDGI